MTRLHSIDFWFLLIALPGHRRVNPSRDPENLRHYSKFQILLGTQCGVSLIIMCASTCRLAPCVRSVHQCVFEIASAAAKMSIAWQIANVPKVGAIFWDMTSAALWQTPCDYDDMIMSAALDIHEPHQQRKLVNQLVSLHHC